MQFYTCITLVDITATGVIRHTPDTELQRNQQRNWETILQCIGLLAQPQLIEGPHVYEYELNQNTIFGEMYYGRQKIWVFSFAVDATDVFLLDNDPVGLLDKNVEQVPIICGLEETARFILPIFYPYGAIKNIYFMNERFRP